MKNTLLTEDDGQQPWILYDITGNHCNGYGDYKGYVNGDYGGFLPGFNWLDGNYVAQSLTWPSVTWDNGNSVPQIGDYFWKFGIVWYVVGATTDYPGPGQTVPPGSVLNIQKATNVGNGEWCTTHWKCNIKPHLHCRKQAISNRPHSPAVGGALTPGHVYANREACLHHCPEGLLDDDRIHTISTTTTTTPTETTNCNSNISGINCLKPLIVPPVNVTQPVTQGGCCMVNFSFSNSPQPTFTIQGCKDSVSGSMGYEVSNNGSPLISATNNGGSAMSFSPTAPGDYTGKVNCDNTQGIDTKTICLKEDPNDPMVTNQGGGYVSGSFLETPCNQSSPTTPEKTTSDLSTMAPTEKTTQEPNSFEPTPDDGQLSEEVERIWTLNQIL